MKGEGTMAETYSDSEEIDCPHCGEGNGDLWEYAMRDGAEKTVECGSCGKPFVLRCSESRSYFAKPIEVTHA